MNKINRLCYPLMLTMSLANAVWAQTILFQDDFNSPPLNATTNVDTTKKWKRGNNSGNVSIQGNYLNVVSQSSAVNGWIVTQKAYSGNNVSASLKILNPGIESDLGISPTSPSPTALNGFYSVSNFYRFYISSDNYMPPYTLYAYRKKGGAPQTELKKLVLPSPYDAGNTLFYIRIRLGDGMIYFEYSFDNCYWYVMYFERFNLSNSTTSSPFYYEIAASNKLINGTPDWAYVDDFKIESYPATNFPVSTILVDPLNSASFDSSANPGVKRRVIGGSFSGGKWKPNSSKPDGNEVTDMVFYDLGRYIENGSLEIDVAKFYPLDQNNTNQNLDAKRHHILAMFRQPWASHHVVENIDTFWDLHTGNQFSGGTKFLSNTYYSCDEFTTEIIAADTTSAWRWAKWVKSATPYRLKVTWDNLNLKYFRNDTLHAWHVLKNPMQLRYLCVGRDSTVSGDLITGFLNNQYPTMSDADGPLYSNLTVKELRPSAAPPAISNIAVDSLYQNAARLSWATTPAAVCYVEYGTTTAYGQKTKVLGAPATAFTTLLSNLNSGTLYHYRINAEGEAGNVVQSADQFFTTTTTGRYVFKPIADTYIENNNKDQNNNLVRPWLYGPTRTRGNFGWMNLMTAQDRDAFLQFNVTGVAGTITQATLRLYGRTTNNNTGANVKQFTPLQSNWEMNATWTDAETTHQYINRSAYFNTPSLGSISSTTAGQWHSVNVSSATPDANNNYYFVLQGTGTAGSPNDPNAFLNCGSFDSRESPNNQPELIIETGQPDFTEMPFALPGVEDGDVAWGDYDRDGDLDIVITGWSWDGSSSLAISKIFRNNNNGSSFDSIAANLLPVSYSAVDWGDYDRDNDPDLVLAGSSASGPDTKIYRNDNGTFVELSRPITGVKYGDVAWGNYDHDQYLDLLVSGQGSSQGFFTQIYKGGFSNGIRTWTPATTITLPQLKYSSAAWGDNNLDGYVDLLLAGGDSTNTDMIRIYRNTKNLDSTWGFTAGTHYPPQVMTASFDWGNFDADNDLDIAFAGRLNTITSVYQRKSNGTYELVDDASLIDVKQGTVAWGDYDNDGDLDLLLTGEQSNPSARISKVYRNDPGPNGTRTFFDIGAPLAGVYYGSAAWGDYDGDGDLDIVLTGNMNASETTGRITKIYRNNLNIPNTAPSVPNNLSHSYSSTDNTYTLTWTKPTDTQTPQAALTYNVMIGTSLQGTDILSPVSHKTTGKRFIPAPGNAGTRNYYILNAVALVNGTKYYWKVQAIDNVFAGSAFSSPDSFIAGAAKTASIVNRDSIAVTPQAIPQDFALSPNYPNPFNPSTRLNLNLPENGRVVAVVYDLKGQEVIRLHDTEMAAGYKFLDWDGRNAAGTVAGNGVYFVKVTFAGESGARKESTSRVLLLK